MTNYTAVALETKSIFFTYSPFLGMVKRGKDIGWDTEVPTVSRQSAYKWLWACLCYAALHPVGRFLVVLSVKG
jgi:hypothetical protein